MLEGLGTHGSVLKDLEVHTLIHVAGAPTTTETEQPTVSARCTDADCELVAKNWDKYIEAQGRGKQRQESGGYESTQQGSRV